MTQRTAGGRIVPFPMTAAYVRRKALENRREGRLLEAADLFRRGAELEEGVECLVDLAQVLAAMGCRQQACQTLCRAIIQEPMRPDAYYHLALCYLEMGRQQEAADCAANCLALDPAGPYAEEIQELMEHLAQPDGVPESNRQGVLARRSVVYQRQGCDEKARQAFKRALRASRKTPFMLYSMGFLLLEQGDTKGALRHAQMALKSDPQSCHEHCMRCMALCVLGNEPLSEKLLD
ncbi:MAG: tetratricopeptide repeat protein, partial [Clostridia bacterium]|nr:tetratricopeptide repeat protein [Clostridia bacterium]